MLVQYNNKVVQIITIFYPNQVFTFLSLPIDKTYQTNIMLHSVASFHCSFARVHTY